MTRAAVPRGNASPLRPGPDLPPEQGTSRQSEQTSEELGASGPRQAQPGGGRPAVLRLGRGFPSRGQQTVSKTPRAFRAGFSARPAQGTRQVLWPKTFWLHTSLSMGSVTRRLGADNHGGGTISLRPRCPGGRVRRIQGLLHATAGHTREAQCTLAAPKPPVLRVTYLTVCHLLSGETVLLLRDSN